MEQSPQSNSPIELTVTIDGFTSVIPCDLLVVGCDPRNLSDVCDFTAQEAAVFARLINYTFHTAVVKVPVPAVKPSYGIILKPEAIQEMEGAVCGYRNETAKQFSLDGANGMAENIITVYQIQGPRATPWTNEQFLQNLQDTLSGLDWWPYASFEICTDTEGQPVALCTPYFDHFTNDNLIAKMPWNYFGVQGTENTLYVHGSTCFESVLQCWQFGEMLLDQLPTIGYQLPSDKGASIVVLGAGPSGMLFAHRLQVLGYTNVRILESTDRFGGKTHTVVVEERPSSGPPQNIVCELGTCYLSPAYDDMADALKDFLQGNIRHGFFITPTHKDPPGANFRGMVTEGQFNGVTMPDSVIGYSDYVGLKGYYEANKPFLDPDNWRSDYDETVVEVEIGLALAGYAALVEFYVGSSLPMPASPPQALLDAGYTSFYDMLKKNDLLILTGLLQYSYSVQGYGPLHKIPAYYGMIWISLPLIEAIVESPIKHEPMVTVLSEGWLDIWDQMATTLNIALDANVTKIDRSA